jgi:hypothetical protein
MAPTPELSRYATPERSKWSLPAPASMRASISLAKEGAA